MGSIKKKQIVKFIEGFKYTKRTSKHGQIAYNIYSKNNIQLNFRPILIVGGRGSKKTDYGDVGISHIAEAMGINKKYFNELLAGKKSRNDYIEYILKQRKK